MDKDIIRRKAQTCFVSTYNGFCIGLIDFGRTEIYTYVSVQQNMTYMVYKIKQINYVKIMKKCMN